MQKQILWLVIFIFLFLTGCNSPEILHKRVKREYFTGGQIHTELIMSDDTGQNGILKTYGYNGHITSIVPIKNGVKNGVEKGFDEKGRVIWKLTYVNGKQEGVQYAYYPNGDVWLSYTYHEGIKNGPAQTYNKDGSVNKRVIYKDGKIVG
jgi:antitoxin component YwqK of YwqJK toxin-antitoxin module